MTALVTAEYQGIAFSFQDDGWFNATAAAKRYGKESGEWLRLPTTVEYLGAIERKHGKIPYLKAKRGRPDRGGGTWLHPELAVMFARWLNVDFALWCDDQIEHLLRGEPLDVHVADELSTVAERMPLYLAAAHALDRYRLAFPVSFRAFNAAAGSTNFRYMTKGQAMRVVPVAARIASGTDTAEDWRLLHASGKLSTAGDGQMALRFEKEG
jgi:hypothetical protein